MKNCKGEKCCEKKIKHKMISFDSKQSPACSDCSPSIIQIGYLAAVIAVETFSLLLRFDISFADLGSWSRLGLEHTLFLDISFDSKQVRPRSLWLLSIYYSNRLLSCCHRCGNFFIAAPLHSRLGKYRFEAFLAKSLRLYKRKVQLFWEGHKNLRNLPHGFDVN